MPFPLTTQAAQPVAIRVKSPSAALSDAAKGGENTDKLKTLKKACSETESLFMNQLLKTMRGTVPNGGLMPAAPGRDIYESISEQQVSVALSQGQGMGIGQALFNAMSSQQGPAGEQDSKTGNSQLRYRTITPRDMAVRGKSLADYRKHSGLKEAAASQRAAESAIVDSAQSPDETAVNSIGKTKGEEK